VCSFDPKRPRISALDIHEWIFEQLHVPENVVNMVQIYGTRRQVYIKFTDFQYLQDLLHSTTGQSEYKHDNGEISQVKIEMAGMGTRRIRLANISSETPDETISFAFSQYGEIKEMQREVWSKAYSYKDFNGVRIVVITLTKRIPSHIMIAEHRGLVPYEGQPTTCNGCGETGHFNQVCPKRRRVGIETTKEPTVSWTDIAVIGNRSPRSDGGKDADQQSIQTSYGDEHQAEDGEAMQEDNTHSTGIASEQSEEPERGAVGGSDVRNNAKAPCVEGRPDVEDSMDCGKEILGDSKRNGGVPTPTSATTRRHEYHNREAGGRGTRDREAGNQKWGSGGGSHSTSRGGEDRDPIEQSQKNKKMRIESVR